MLRTFLDLWMGSEVERERKRGQGVNEVRVGWDG